MSWCINRCMVHEEVQDWEIQENCPKHGYRFFGSTGGNACPNWSSIVFFLFINLLKPDNQYSLFFRMKIKVMIYIYILVSITREQHLRCEFNFMPNVKTCIKNTSKHHLPPIFSKPRMRSPPHPPFINKSIYIHLCGYLLQLNRLVKFVVIVWILAMTAPICFFCVCVCFWIYFMRGNLGKSICLVWRRWAILFVFMLSLLVVLLLSRENISPPSSPKECFR